MKKLIGNREFYKLVAALALPLLLQNTVSTFVNLLDNLMVGQIGTEQMSGVSIVNQILFVVNLCIFGGVGGSGIFGAQFHGRGDSNGVKQTLRFNIWQCAGITVVACVLLTLADDALIGAFLHDSDSSGSLTATLEYGKQYLRIMLWSLPPFALTNAYVGVLRSTGDTRLPMVASVTAVLVNLVFNYILIFGKLGFPALGIRGAAIATVISRIIEAAIVGCYVLLHDKRLRFRAADLFVMDRMLLRDFLKYGLPIIGGQVVWAVNMLASSAIMGRNPAEGAVVAMSIAGTVNNLAYVVMNGMSGAVGIITGKTIGAGKRELMKDRYGVEIQEVGA